MLCLPVISYYPLLINWASLLPHSHTLYPKDAPIKTIKQKVKQKVASWGYTCPHPHYTPTYVGEYTTPVNVSGREVSYHIPHYPICGTWVNAHAWPHMRARVVKRGHALRRGEKRAHPSFYLLWIFMNWVYLMPYSHPWVHAHPCPQPTCY
jgi:hypothetical protein